MRAIAFLPLALLVASGLTGCSEACRDGPDDGFGIKYVNETTESYYIYMDWGHGGFDEEWFPPAERPGAAGAVAPGCELLGPTWYLRIQIREPKPNHEDVWAPEIRGGELAFDGNWTGLQCNQSYVFESSGPEKVEAYERELCSDFTWKRDLTRVPP